MIARAHESDPLPASPGALCHGVALRAHPLDPGRRSARVGNGHRAKPLRRPSPTSDARSDGRLRGSEIHGAQPLGRGAGGSASRWAGTAAAQHGCARCAGSQRVGFHRGPARSCAAAPTAPTRSASVPPRTRQPPPRCLPSKRMRSSALGTTGTTMSTCCCPRPMPLTAVRRRRCFRTSAPWSFTSPTTSMLPARA